MMHYEGAGYVTLDEGRRATSVNIRDASLKRNERVTGDLRVRQAMDLAIDKQAIVDRLLGGHTVIATSILPFISVVIDSPMPPFCIKTTSLGLIPAASSIDNSAK